MPVGVNKFVLQSDAPNFLTVPEYDILGVTVVLVTCSYKEQEFVRVGYYVNNEYTEEYDPEVGPPSPLDMTKVVRQILADKPRVTRFPINWCSGVHNQTSEQTQGVNHGTNEHIEDQNPVDITADDEDLADVEMEEDFEEEEEEDDNEEAEIDLGDDEDSFKELHSSIANTSHLHCMIAAE